MAEANSLSLLGTWRGLNDSQADQVRAAITEKGGWASWWSFPVREEFHQSLQGTFYIYLNASGDRITHRMRVERFRTSQGNVGIESPWPEITDSELVGKTRNSDTNAGVFKTWLYVTAIETLPRPLSHTDFRPADGLKQNSILNQSAFGYAQLREPTSQAQSPSTSRVDAVGNSNGMGGSSLSEKLEQFLASYITARNSEAFSKEASAYVLMDRLVDDFRQLPSVAAHASLVVRGSVGQGNWGAVPWIAFLDKRETNTTQDGVYAVVLFRSDMSGAYLTYNQGVTEPNNQGRSEGRRLLRTVIDKLRPLSRSMRSADYSLDDSIDLRVDKGLGSRYEESTIAHKLYQAGSIPDDRSIDRDLSAVLEDYARYVAEKNGEVVPETIKPSAIIPTLSLPAIVDDFAIALAEAGVHFGSNHRQVVATFVTSLVTKRFVILTGLSGSGKTQLAIRFGEWLGADRSRVVPVRPDWTGAESLFGYEDALRDDSNGRRAWHVPAPLEFMLRAARDQANPFVLILDEMNLAHVERYFADALSGIETDLPCLPNLRVEPDGQWRLPPHGPDQVALPTNLFVVGTVNVDETTYMFSPKVLDRANTIEFRVETEALGARKKPTSCRSGPAHFVAGFIELARRPEWLDKNPAPYVAEFDAYVRRVHAILAEEGFEFGHRVYYEASRFAALVAPVVANDVYQALDLQIMQKMLPRLHGSRRRLEPVLCAMGQFCLDPDIVTSGTARFDPIAASAAAKLPTSFAKIRRMTRSLRANQFAGFAE